MNDFTVRLALDMLPEGENREHALKVAEGLLRICGVYKQWVEPKHGHTIFYVKTMPQDVEQVGVYWVKVDLPQNPYEKVNQ